MGMITDTMRYHELQGQKRDLSFKIQQITMEKSRLVKSGNDLMRVGTDYDPDSPAMKTLQKRQADMRLIEEQLEQQMSEYKIQLQAVDAELGDCKQRLGEEIKEEMKYSL